MFDADRFGWLPDLDRAAHGSSIAALGAVLADHVFCGLELVSALPQAIPPDLRRARCRSTRRPAASTAQALLMPPAEIGTEEFADLYRRHCRQVHAYLRRRVANDAEDLLSEVFIVAWRRRRDLPVAPLHGPWLYGVARTLLKAHLRKNPPSPTASVGPSRACVATHETQERHAVVRRALEELPVIYRELLMLTTWENLSVAEAAFTLGIQPGTARVRLHRARRQLANNPELQALVSNVVHDAAPR